MVDKRNKNKSLVVSSLVTLSVIAMLIASVPANAVTVSISGLSGSITQGTSKTFMVTVTMDSPDKFVPVSNITLSINGPTTKQWTFDPVCGILQSSDKNITIKVISPPKTGDFGYGYGYGVDTVGYGYGYNFGYGYGYGYNNGQGGGRISFTYQVTLLTTDLAAGSYTATAFLNTGNPAKANFASSDTSFTIVTRNTQDKGSISGMKFNDSNADGIKDIGEPGLKNWTIKLIDSGGNVKTTTTDVNGDYNFSGLLEDNYTVAEIPMPGWTQTFPIGGVYTVNLKPGENIMNADFGNFNGSLGIPEISGMKFNDSNGNGKKDPGEAGLADWLIKLNDSFGNNLTTITDSNGNYTFHLSDTDGGVGAGSNLRGLNYTVEETLKPGWTQTFPVNGTYKVQYREEQDLQPLDFKDLDFGNTAGTPSPQTECKLPIAGNQTSNISGMKFNDSNADGIKDIGEHGLENWTIKLIDSGGNIKTTTTDANGNYSFSGLLEDIYTVAEVSKPGWNQTFPLGGVYTVNLKPGENITGKDFGNMLVVRPVVGSISGFKINTANGMDLQGWTIRLIGIIGIVDKGTGTRVIRMNTTTNADGLYMFNNLPAGRYIIREELQRGFVPVSSPVKLIMLTLGENSMNNNFTNRPIK